jgi:uncharacterized membrane protein
MKLRKKLALCLTELILSVLIPNLIGKTFTASFPEFYDHGFLTGIGMMFVAVLMCLLNLTVFSTVLNSYFKKYITNKALPGNYFKIAFLFLVASIAVQIIITILIENPFGEPSTFDF